MGWQPKRRVRDSDGVCQNEAASALLLYTKASNDHVLISVRPKR